MCFTGIQQLRISRAKREKKTCPMWSGWERAYQADKYWHMASVYQHTKHWIQSNVSGSRKLYMQMRRQSYTERGGTLIHRYLFGMTIACMVRKSRPIKTNMPRISGGNTHFCRQNVNFTRQIPVARAPHCANCVCSCSLESFFRCWFGFSGYHRSSIKWHLPSVFAFTSKITESFLSELWFLSMCIAL